MWSPSLEQAEPIVLALEEGHPAVFSPERRLANSIRTALSTIPTELTKGISAVRTVSADEFATAARAAGHRGSLPEAIKVGDEILLDAGRFGASDSRVRTRLIREAVAQHHWSTNASLRSKFGKLFKADSSLRRLGTDSRAAFCRGFSRLNGGLSREIGFARYYGGVDRWMRSALGKADLSEPQRAFYQLMRTGRGLGTDIRVANQVAIGRYEKAIDGITKRIGLPKVQKARLTDPNRLKRVETLVQSNRASMVRTYNNRLARHIDNVTKELQARGVAITQKNIAAVARDYADREFARQQLIAQRFEDAWMQSVATQDFIQKNRIEVGELYIVPGNVAVCQRCVELIGGSPYAIDALKEWPPLHKNCVHGVELRTDPANVPANPWLG